MLLSKEKNAYQIILGCCLLYAAVSGIGGNCKGIFYTSVAESLQVSLSELTFASTLGGIVSAFCMVPCCALFKRASARVSLTIMGACYSISLILMGCADSLIWYYVSSVFQGVFSGFLIYYPIQYIVGNWFPEKSGTTLGFILMSSGVVGMIMNPLASNWISRFGWRISYWMLGCLMLLLILPATMFFLQKAPKETQQNHGQKQSAIRSRRSNRSSSVLPFPLPVLFGLLFCLDLCIALTQHLPSFSVSVGRTAVFGASLVSASMVGNLTGKIVLGAMNDRLGVFFTTVVGTFAVALGCFCINIENEMVIFISAFLIGLILSVVTLQIPLIFRKNCDPDLYEKVFPIVCSVNIVVGAASHTIISIGFNFFESYEPVLILAAVDMLLCIILTISVEKHQKIKCFLF